MTRRLAIAIAAAWILVFTVSSTAVEGTTLAIIRTGNQIVIAADSLMTLYGRRPQLTCKIQRHGDVVFATAGLVSATDGVIEFHHVITNILRRQLPWSEQTAQVEEWVREPLLRTLRTLERQFPAEFETHLRRSFTLHVSLAGVIDGRPQLEMLEYFVFRSHDQTLQLRVERFSCPGSCAEAAEVFGIGETTEMMQTVVRLQHLPADIAELARDLVDSEIVRNPQHVGPPIDVVRLGPAGVEWVSRKPACHD